MRDDVDPEALRPLFEVLARSGSLPLERWPEGAAPEDFGLERRDAVVVPMGGHDPLDAVDIRRHLSRTAAAVVNELRVHPVIGSTNRVLMQIAQHQSVHGHLHSAELQVQGRGRRGRSWASPFGANLALSLGLATRQPPSALGGISLVVGLAVLDALEGAGVAGLALKWPNDILRDGAKLGGILIEITGRAPTELVIGIGLNVVLPEPIRAALPQAVADLADVPERPARSRLLAAVVSSVVEFVGQFDDIGFEPFLDAFDARHFYHQQDCCILQGADRVWGRVVGVNPGGELLLRTGDGVRTFNGGEVSLRRQA